MNTTRTKPPTRNPISSLRLGLSALLALLLLTRLTWGITAQDGTEQVPVTLHGEIDRNPITVGDQVVYTLHAEHPPDATVNLPNLPPEWGTLEVLAQQPAPLVVPGEELVRSSKQYTLTAFSVGDHSIAALPVDYFLPGGERGTLQTELITLTVQSVVTDTAMLAEMDIAGLKAQADIPPDITESYVVGGGSFAALVALALTALWWLSRRKRRQAKGTVIDNRLPEEIAYDELTHIKELALPERNRIKEHYTLLSNCLRRYAERLYGISAMGRTTWEFSTALRKARVDRDHTSLFVDLFTQADLVKFAKSEPEVREAYQAVAQAQHIVDVTKPERSAQEATGNGPEPDTKESLPASSKTG